MAWILLGEIFPLNVRGTAMSLAAFANWTGKLLVGLFFPVLVGIGAGIVLYLFVIVGVIASLFRTAIRAGDQRPVAGTDRTTVDTR